MNTTRSLLCIVKVVPLFAGLGLISVQAQVGGLPVNPEAGNNNNPSEASAADMDRVAFDDNLLHNGFTQLGNPVEDEPVPLRSFRDNKFIFDEFETIEDGLGPTYNAQSCRECHQNPTSGGGAQITEQRAGHLVNGSFVDAPGDSLIASRAVAASIQEYVPDSENVRSFRTSLNLMGDGFVECVSNTTLINIRNGQPAAQRGLAIAVPVVEANGALRIGRFGHKNQHASLVSFAGDAYLNEMGITNPFQSVEAFQDPNNIVENSSLGRSVARYDALPEDSLPDHAEDDGLDVLAFADFMRATRSPGRSENSSSQAVQSGQALFSQIGCAVCHVPSMVTAPAGTRINGGEFVVPQALGNKTFRPFGDFLLHDVGTGDGIVQNGGQATRNMVRTAPLWGVRTRNRLMHDGESLTFNDAIQRHRNQGDASRVAFNNLSNAQRANVVAFLRSL